MGILKHRAGQRNVFAGAVFFTAVSLVAVLWWQPAQARQPAPVVEGGAQPTSSELDKRLKVIERRLDSQSMMEVLTQLNRIQQEMQTLVGQMELINHEMTNLKKRQKDLYVDIDRRISQVEKKAALAQSQPGGQTSVEPSAQVAGTSPTLAPASGAVQASPQSRMLQREAYDRAFNLLKDGRYELAIASFKAYLETYPGADYADNAQYWLGEANYAQRRYDAALQEFNKVLDNYPKSPKRADAMLKMGFSYQELGKKQDAEVVLNNIVTHFPDTTAARLAKKRLRELKTR